MGLLFSGQRLAHRVSHLIDLQRFGQVVVGTFLQRLHCGWHCGVSGDNDYLGLGISILHLLQTRLFYDGLAQDVPEMTAQGSVALMLSGALPASPSRLRRDEEGASLGMT